MSRRRRLLIWLATGGERGGDGLALGKGSGPRPARGTSRGSLGQTKESFFLLGICRCGGRYCMGTPNDLTTLQHNAEAALAADAALAAEAAPPKPSPQPLPTWQLALLLYFFSLRMIVRAILHYHIV